MMKAIYIILLALLGSLGVQAQTAQPNLPTGAERYSQTLWIAPDSTLWTGKGGNYARVGTWHEVDSLFGLGYTKAQVDSAITSQIPAAQTLSLGSNAGNLSISSGNSVSLASIARTTVTDFLTFSPPVGLWVTYNTTGSTNYPLTAGTGLRVERGSGSNHAGSFEFWRGASSNSNRVLINTGTTSGWNGFETLALLSDTSSLLASKQDVLSIPTNQIFQACVVRYNSTTSKWEIIDDGTHAPLNIDSVTNATNTAYNFTVWYTSSNVSEVGSVTGAVDESYATLGLFVGASVGSAQAHFRITSKGLYVNAFYDGDSWELDSSAYNPVLPQAVSLSFDAGNLTISHPGINVLNDFLSVQSSGNYTVALVSKTLSQTVVRFIDSNGDPVLTPDTDMTVDLYRNGVYYIPNSAIRSTTPVGATNIWIQGIHRKLE